MESNTALLIFICGAFFPVNGHHSLNAICVVYSTLGLSFSMQLVRCPQLYIIITINRAVGLIIINEERCVIVMCN